MAHIAMRKGLNNGGKWLISKEVVNSASSIHFSIFWPWNVLNQQHHYVSTFLNIVLVLVMGWLHAINAAGSLHMALPHCRRRKNKSQ